MLQLYPYFPGKIESNLTTHIIQRNYFTDTDIHRVESYVHANCRFEKGQTGTAELGEVYTEGTNNRDIAYITPTQESKWIYDKLFPLVHSVNESNYKFDIDIVTDLIHYVVYPTNGGHLDWHMDIGSHSVNKRKLAVVVTLSNRDEYTGGEFELLLGGEEAIRPELNRGDVIIFPTYLLHRVKPIINGTRKVIVFWVGGRPFR